MTYRSYQIKAIDKAIEFYNDRKNKKRPFIVAPTGAGKSWIIAGIADKIDTPIVIIQPSKELLSQNYEKYTSLGNKASIYSASLKSKEIGHVTFATIGSIVGEVDRFKQAGVKLVIVDECHIGSSKSNELGRFITGIGDVKVIGLTATPVILKNGLEGPVLKMLNRTNKSFWNQVLDITQISEVVNLGFWSKLVYETPEIDDSVLELNTSRSEYTEDSMEEMYEENDIESKVIRRIEELKGSRKSILVFVPSVAKARELGTKIPDSVVVWGNMPPKDREKAVSDFKSGHKKVAINVNVLAIGFDHPEIDVVIDTVATASIGRYYQKLGRGCRIHPLKKDCLIIDYSNNFSRFGKLEQITFEEDIHWGWQMFCGNRMMTNVNFNDEPVYKTSSMPKVTQIKFTFGKFKDKLVSEVPIWYLNWCLENVTWNRQNMDIKNEILRLKQ